ncbi:MAG: hypothetical protein ACRDHL_05445 [Candidatus Promineifilaceae bacterium]
MITQAELEDLVAFSAPDGRTVSLYLDTDTGELPQEQIKLQARSLLKEADDIESDAERILEYLDFSYDWSKPGLALFSNAGQNFFRSYPAAVAFRNRMRLGARPHVKPLNHLLDHYAHYGVIALDKVGAQFYEYHLGELQDNGQTMGDDVRKVKHGGGSARAAGGAAASGRRGGAGDRHEEEVSQRNLREAATAAQAFFARKPIRRLFLAGTAENVAQFRDYLPKQLQSCLAGSFAHDMDAGEPAVRARSLGLLHEANARREQELVRTLITAAAKGGNAVVGLEDTLSKVSQRRVQTLVISDGYRAPGYLDEASATLSSREDGTPEGAAPRRLEDVVEAAVAQTIGSGGRVEIISDNQELEDAGRIGAVLRY